MGELIQKSVELPSSGVEYKLTARKQGTITHNDGTYTVRAIWVDKEYFDQAKFHIVVPSLVLSNKYSTGNQSFLVLPGTYHTVGQLSFYSNDYSKGYVLPRIQTGMLSNGTENVFVLQFTPIKMHDLQGVRNTELLSPCTANLQVYSFK